MATKGSKRGSNGNTTRDGERKSGELRGSGEVRTALIRGDTFGVKAVQYVEIDGLAMFEGDIVLGTVEEVERMSEMLRAERVSGATSAIAASVAISGAQFRWPNCRIPYTIDPALPDQARVTDAIAHWQARTNFRFVARTTEADYVTFRPGSGCSAAVGRRGGQQFVNLAPNCTAGNTIHEIGHVVGLWHEQSREDRDSFVRINWTKITPGMEHNFNQHITDGDDIGAYDFGSIMHYPLNAFSVDGSNTITPVGVVPAGTIIGQRATLSAGDVAAANSFCPRTTTVKEAPKDVITDKIKEQPRDTRKEIIKDGQLDTLKEQPFDTRKEATKDIRLDTRKEQILDTLKEQARDTIKEGTFDPGTLRENVITPGGPSPVVNPRIGGGALPFAMATPALDAGTDAGSAELPAAIERLDAQLQQLSEQLAQTEAARAALQEQFDETSALLAQLVQAHDASGG